MVDLSLSSDPEIALLYSIDRAFRRMSHDARSRVLSWAACKSQDMEAKKVMSDAADAEVRSWISP